MLSNFRQKSGFTLVELIIVIVVIGILATFITLSYMGIAKKADKEALRAGARSIVRAAQAFEYQHPGNHKFYFQDGEQSNDDGFKLSYGNKAPGSGTVVLNEKETVAVAFYKGVFCAAKSADTDVITVSEISQSDCTTYDVIQTCDSWATIATANDVLLADLLDLNGETDPDSSTCGRNIKIPVEIEFPTSASCFAFNSGTGTITDYYYTNPSCPSDVNIPNRIGGVTVVAIGDSAFESSNLTSVIIPNTVTSLAYQAFRNNKLTTITIPSSITSCNYDVFDLNNFTGGIVWNSTANTGLAGHGPFEGATIASITLADNITSIPGNLFSGATFTFTSYKIPDQITEIKYGGFRSTNLTTVDFNNVTVFGDNAFYGGSLTTINLKEGVTAIGQSAFESCDFASLTVPSTVTSVEYDAFYGINLTSLTWNSNLTGTGSSGNGPFGGGTIGTVTLGNNLDHIPGNLFSGVTFSNTSYTIPSQITEVKYGGFRSTNLTTVDFNNVTVFGDYAFYGGSLTTIDLKEGVTSIGQDAFNDNDFTTLTVPSTVTTVGYDAFYSINLSSLTWNSNLSGTGSSGNGPFGGGTISSITLGNNLDHIPGNLFSGVTFGSTSYTVPAHITSISYGGLRGTNLTSVNLNNVTSLGSNAFYQTPITTLTIPAGFTTIGDYAFQGTSLTSIIMGNGTTTLGSNVMASNNNFRTTYYAGGAGTYTSATGPTGTWTKI